MNNDQITVQELKAKMDAGEKFILLDVREDIEVKRANIGGVHIPMNAVPMHLKKLDPSQEVIVYCHHGNRSQAIVNFLRASGYQNARNLVGGINEWSLTIDPSIPKY